MEGVKQMNMVVVRGPVQEIGISRRDPYAMEIDRGRNCYICGGFGHMIHQCHVVVTLVPFKRAIVSCWFD